jgi:hypothetical protein
MDAFRGKVLTARGGRLTLTFPNGQTALPVYGREEEAELRRLQTEKQTIYPRDLTPDKRRALIEEVFAILGETGKG